MKTNQVLFFDTETTGIIQKGQSWDVDFMAFPHIVQLAWKVGQKERVEIIKPEGWVIPEEVAKIHGVTQERAEKEGKPFKEVFPEFIEDCRKAPIICAHNIYFDTSVLKADVLRYYDRQYYDEVVDAPLHSEKRIDTMYKTRKFVGACFKDGRPGKFPTLSELYAKLFDGAEFPAHDAMCDVKALAECFDELVKRGIVELKIKEPKQLTFQDQFKPIKILLEEPEEEPKAEPKVEPKGNPFEELMKENDF